MKIILRTSAGYRFICLLCTGGLLCMGALAQQTSPLSGWTAQQQGQKAIFTPDNVKDGSTWVSVQAEESPHGADLNAELGQRVQADMPGRGTLVSKGQVNHVNDHALTMSIVYRDNKDQQYIILYFIIQKSNGHVQFAMVRTPAGASMQEYIKQGATIIAKSTGATNDKPQQQTAVASPAQDSKPTNGVAISDIVVLIHEGRQVNDGLGLKYQENIDLLLKDGTMFDHLSDAPEEFNVAASCAHDPSSWHRWRKQGDTYYQLDTHTGKWESINGSEVKALEQGTQLRVSITRSDFASFGMSGGSASNSSFHFYPDGRYDRGSTITNGSGRSGGISTRDKNGQQTTTSSVGGNVVANAGSGNRAAGAGMAGTYRVNGYTLELRSNDNKVQRLLAFYPYSDVKPGKVSIFIGGVSYLSN